MSRQLWTAALAAAVVALVLDIGIYQYAMVGPVSAESMFHLPFSGAWPKLVLAALLGALVLAWLYEKGRTEAPWIGQGLRFGLAVAILTHGCMGLLGATILSHEGEAIVIGGIALGMARDLVLGLVVAFMYRNGPATS